MTIELDPDAVTFFSHWKPDDLGPKSFGNPPDCNLIDHTNTRAFRAAEIPAANAHANARALARVYGALDAATISSRGRSSTRPGAPTSTVTTS